MLWVFLFTNLSLVIATILLLGIARTTRVQHDARQKKFLAGKIPPKLPDGLYKGSVEKVKTTWMGKSFNAQEQSGINNFSNKGKVTKGYPFKTYVAKGIQDKNKDVIKVDYNIASNPFWLRLILDEIVEIEPNRFLGKVHIRILPRAAITIGYFNLEQNSV